MRSLLSEWAEIIRGAIVMVLWAAVFPMFALVDVFLLRGGDRDRDRRGRVRGRRLHLARVGGPSVSRPKGKRHRWRYWESYASVPKEEKKRDV